MRPDEEIIKRWRGSAPFWNKHRDIIRGMFAPVTQALIEDAAIGSHDSVLDVASGPGRAGIVRTDLQRRLIKDGYRLRIYIPYGRD
jgi:hypothetical protein